MHASSTRLAAIAIIRVFAGVVLLWHAVGDAAERIELTDHDAARASALGIGVQGPDRPRVELASADDVEPVETSAPTRARRVHLRTLAIAEAAGPTHLGPSPEPAPEPAPEGTPIVEETPRTLPAVFARAPWPALLAWASWVMQILAAAGLLVGLLTRFASGVSLVLFAGWAWVAWLGPVAIGVPGASLWPGGASMFDLGAWTPVLLAVSLAVACAATLIAGPGLAGIDHMMADDSDEYEPDDD